MEELEPANVTLSRPGDDRAPSLRYSLLLAGEKRRGNDLGKRFIKNTQTRSHNGRIGRKLLGFESMKISVG